MTRNPVRVLALKETDVVSGELSYSVQVWLGNEIMTDASIDEETYEKMLVSRPAMAHRRPLKSEVVEQELSVAKAPPTSSKTVQRRKPLTIEEALGLERKTNGKKANENAPEGSEVWEDDSGYGEGSPFDAKEV